MAETLNQEKLLSDEDIRRLVVARLKVLSPDTIISFGSDGSFSRDELVEKVQQKDEIGEKMAEIQMEWLRSFNEELV
ncbi:MAG: hypothetical protein WCX69_01480 [Candidatus Paceibacterota bacterium]